MTQLKADRVLVLAPFGRDAALLARVLNRAQIPAETSQTMAGLCAEIFLGVGSVLVADEALVGDGMELLQGSVHGQEAWSDLPIFVMTQSESDGRMRLKHLEPLGNVTVLERPLRGETVVSALRMGLRARSHQYQLRARLEAEREAARALRESERRYRTLTEAVPQLVWTCRPDGECDYLSRQWQEYTGAPENEHLGFKWLESIHADDRARADVAWRNAYQSGGQYELEYRLRRADGEYRWFQTRGVPLKDGEGQVQKWFGSCTDIEAQKQVSEERRQLLAREQKARGLAELLNRVGPMLLEELDSGRLAQKITDLATQLTGAQFGALFLSAANKDLAEYKLYWSGAFPLPRNTEIFDRILLGGGGTVVSDDVTQDPRFKQTAIFPGEMRSYLGVPLVSRSGKLMGALVFGSVEVGVFRELHTKLAKGVAAQAAIALDNARLFAEAQEAQETLRQSNVDLRRANEDLNQFAYSASHDLQEPLRMVALYSQMMERHYKPLLSGLGLEYLSFMVQGAKRMEMLLKDLLDYTQVVAGSEENIEQTDANVVLQTAAQNLQQAISETGAKVDGKNLPLLAVRQVYLLQLLQNLIGNALKYRGSEPPEIEITSEPEGKFWKIKVRDNGIGIAPQYSKQVFGLFKRLHGNSQYEGTGIGLAICQKIVERYGGRIWVESEGEGKGSTFWFTLPGVSLNVQTSHVESAIG